MLLQRLHFNKDTMIELMRIAIPMIVSQGTFAVMIFTDRYFMSQIDPVHMAAALGGGVAAYFSFCFFAGLFSYANALAAQYLGAGEIEKCPKVVTQGFIMIAMSVPVLIVITLLVAGIFQGMGHDPEQVELERSYYQVLMLGTVLTLAKICISSYFAGIARAKLVMVCDVCGLVLNVPLCYAMVFGKLGFPEMGIIGAGVSTIIATLFSLLLFIACYFRKEHREKFRVMDSFKFDHGIFRRFVRLGFPSGLELFLNVAAFNLFLLMFQGYGIVEGASAAIVFSWDILSFVPMMGLNIGLVSMIGRFVGAQDMERADAAISAGFILGLSYSVALALIYITFRFPLVEVFAPPEGDFSEVLELAGFMMVGLSSYAVADAVIQVCGGVLRGAGDTRWIMYCSTFLHWIMLVAQYLIIRVFEWGPKASWLAFVVMILLIAVVFVGRLRGDRWRDEKALRLVMTE
jgi:MATE family multidrug resistance protein